MSHDANILENESSPYLLQHAANPVHWQPWGEEAFELARTLDKPVFLSIGYSTCHWCHVMEKETFEDEEAAKALNETFICIKVDREERPDVDGVYMTACQLMTGSGGWPLTVLLTADRKPFFAGTYFPKESVPGRIGILDLCQRIRELWTTERAKIDSTSNRITEHMKELELHSSHSEIGDAALHKAATAFASSYDATHGGFGNAPKFPSPHILLFLLRHQHRTGSTNVREMVVHTLTAMRMGGIWDHIGFGFHRYSTDRQWLLPHFEKMLYDQAMLLLAYTEAWQVTRNPLFSQTVQELAAYLFREMRAPQGAFHSAQDADSEGEEGLFYIWTTREVDTILDEQAPRFRDLFGITDEGNFLEESTRERTGRNIPHIAKDKTIPSPESTEGKALDLQRRKLLEKRMQRIHPFKDKTIHTDWNGLMIAALARAGRTMDEQYAAAASLAADFLLQTMLRPKARLWHCFRDGTASVEATLTDHAFLAWGLLELYEAVFNLDYLEAAISVVDAMNRNFWDHENGGYHTTAHDEDSLPVRQKELYDAAIPSGNSVAMHVLSLLARITGNPAFSTKVEELKNAFAVKINEQPSAYTHFLSGLDFTLSPPLEVVIVGERYRPDTLELLKIVNTPYQPNMIIMLKDVCGSTQELERLEELAPFTAEMKMIEDKATAYVCKNYSCHEPTADPNRLEELIRTGSNGKK